MVLIVSEYRGSKGFWGGVCRVGRVWGFEGF